MGRENALLENVGVAFLKENREGGGKRRTRERGGDGVAREGGKGAEKGGGHGTKGTVGLHYEGDEVSLGLVG